jgi:uncharacterized protein (DUF433 family)
MSERDPSLARRKKDGHRQARTLVARFFGAHLGNEKMQLMPTPTDLLTRPTYGLAQVDRLLMLSSGTARRWLEGYARSGKEYPPVVRERATGNETVTWGEFVETRLLAEFRDAGVPMVRMRPAVERLREELNTPFPLAHARPYLSIEGRELVRKIQDDVRLDRSLQLVVVRNDQIILSPRAENFRLAVDFSPDREDAVVERLRPVSSIHHVVVDPLRQFGEPVVRSVPTEVIAEQVRAGESPESISALYDLEPAQVAAAIRFELMRVAAERPVA